MNTVECVMGEDAPKDVELSLPVMGQLEKFNLPSVYERAAVALPIITRLYGGEHKSFFSCVDLHAQLGGTYRLTRWVNDQIKEHDLKSGVDYVLEEIEMIPETARLRQRCGSHHTLFSQEIAAFLIIRSKSPEARPLLNYLNALGAACSRRMIEIVKQARAHALRLSKFADENEKTTLALAKEKGFQSISSAEMYFQHQRRAAIEHDIALEHKAAAVFMWEQITEAQRMLAANRAFAAQKSLAAVTDRYGNYNELEHQEPPWLTKHETT